MTRLAISNLAWQPEETDAVVELLGGLPVEGVEIAPTKIWESPLEASPAEVLEVRDFWERRGLPVVALQSVLFGRPDLRLFGDAATRASTRRYLEGMIRLAGRLGARAIVFGSPGNRRRGGLSAPRAHRLAVPFFAALGDVAERNQTCFCIEPNPVEYGCDYVSTSREGAELVRQVSAPGFGLHLDAAAMTLTGEAPPAAIERSADVLRHFHVSEPGLAPIGQGGVTHSAFGAALRSAGYGGWVSIEMLPTAVGSALSSIERAVAETVRCYLELPGTDVETA